MSAIVSSARFGWAAISASGTRIDRAHPHSASKTAFSFPILTPAGTRRPRRRCFAARPTEWRADATRPDLRAASRRSGPFLFSPDLMERDRLARVVGAVEPIMSSILGPLFGATRFDGTWRLPMSNCQFRIIDAAEVRHRLATKSRRHAPFPADLDAVDRPKGDPDDTAFRAAAD